MKAIRLKFTLAVIAFIIAMIGVPGVLSCGFKGSTCPTEETFEIRNFSMYIFGPALLIFMVLLFLPLRFFGDTKNNMINDST